MSIVQPTNTTDSFQNQPTGSPVHSVIKTVEFKRGHRVRSDGRTIIYNVKMFFYESKRRLEPISGGSFGSPEKRYGMSRKKVVTDDFDRAAIRRTVHEFYTHKKYPTVQMLLQAVHQKGIFVGEKTS